MRIMKIPRRVVVRSLLEGRYGDKSRPLSWDKRYDGYDVVELLDGEQLRLFSNGGQESPRAGWELLLLAEAALPEDQRPTQAPEESAASSPEQNAIEPAYTWDALRH